MNTDKENLRYSEHLTWKEIACKGFDCHCDGGFVVKELPPKFEHLRDLCTEHMGHDCPLIINSGYRCPEHNRRVSMTGRKGPHTRGIALDIRCPEGMDYDIFYSLCLLAFGDGGVGRYRMDRFVHCDVRGFEARWDG